LRVLLNRLDYGDKQTLGEYHVYDGIYRVESFKCLELPWLDNQVRISCIPTAEYKVIKHISPKFKKSFWIQDVPDRTQILIHVGNYYDDILGCQLAGLGFGDIDGDGLIDVTGSAKAIERMWNLLPDIFYLNIYGKY